MQTISGYQLTALENILLSSQTFKTTWVGDNMKLVPEPSPARSNRAPRTISAKITLALVRACGLTTAAL